MAVGGHEVKFEQLAFLGAGFFSGRRLAGGGFEVAFAEAVALAFNDEEVDVVSEAINEGGDTGGVREDGIPVFEGTISSDDEGAALVTAIDDLEEQIGSGSIVREITEFINAEQLRASIESELTAAECWGVALEIGDQFGSGTKDDRVAG